METNSINGAYDTNLLTGAPEISKQARQAGYNTDLLDDGNHGKSTPTMVADSQDAAELGRPKEQIPLTGAPPPGSEHKSTPFYKTKKGMIIIGVVFIVIVAAVVGGAVGGSKGGNKNKKTSGAGNGTASTNSSSSPTSDGGSSGPSQQGPNGTDPGTVQVGHWVIPDLSANTEPDSPQH